MITNLIAHYQTGSFTSATRRMIQIASRIMFSRQRLIECDHHLLLGVPCHGMVDLIPIQEEAQGRFELCLQEVQFHGPLFIGYKLL